MKKFNYSLKGVLKVKERMEKVCKSQLVAAVKALGELQREKKAITSRRNLYKCKKREHEHLGVEAPILLLYDAYLRKMDRDIDSINMGIKKSETQIEELRDERLSMSRERKMLERIEDKEYRAHKKEGLKGEQRVLDEVAARLN